MDDIPKVCRGRRLKRTFSFWEAVGCSRKGNITPRDGKAVTCGHRHKTEVAARWCAEQMRKNRPGRCQNYRASEMIVAVYSPGGV